MKKKGKLIVLEGLPGSDTKELIISMAKYLRRHGINVGVVGEPPANNNWLLKAAPDIDLLIEKMIEEEMVLIVEGHETITKLYNRCLPMWSANFFIDLDYQTHSERVSKKDRLPEVEFTRLQQRRLEKAYIANEIVLDGTQCHGVVYAKLERYMDLLMEGDLFKERDIYTQKRLQYYKQD